MSRKCKCEDACHLYCLYNLYIAMNCMKKISFWRNVNIFIEFWFLSFLYFVYLYLKWEWIQGNIPALNGRFKQITRVKIRRNSGVIQRRNLSVKERRNLGVKNEAEFGSKKRRISVNKLHLESFDFPGGANLHILPQIPARLHPNSCSKTPGNL